MKLLFKKSSILLLLIVTMMAFSINYFSKSFVNKSNANNMNSENDYKGDSSPITVTKANPIFNEKLDSNIVLIGNLQTGHIIHNKNIEVRTSIASITK